MVAWHMAIAQRKKITKNRCFFICVQNTKKKAVVTKKKRGAFSPTGSAMKIFFVLKSSQASN